MTLVTDQYTLFALLTSVTPQSTIVQSRAVMGQAETKLFHDVPGWYLSFAGDHTDLQPDTVQICWNFWRTDSR